MKKYVTGALCALMISGIILLSACDTARPDALSFEAMDTVMSLTVYGGGEDICGRLKSRIDELDSLFDATDENSEIYRLNTDKTAEVSPDTAELLNLSLSLCERLGGYFDITVYPAVLEWGFTTGEYRVPDDDALSRLSDKIDYRSVTSNQNRFTIPDGTMIDLGAVAKGRAADECIDILKESGASGAVLNLGGTIGLYREKPDGSPFKVGVADPMNSAGYFGYLSCGEGVLATSGGYERYFTAADGTTYIHILDPSTAKPVDNGLQSVTVFSDSGSAADAMSTALFVMGLDKAEEYYRQNGGFDFIILTDGGDLYITDGIYDSFTLAEGYEFKIYIVNR